MMSVNIQEGQNRHTAHNSLSRESSNQFDAQRLEMERAVTSSDNATHDEVWLGVLLQV